MKSSIYKPYFGVDFYSTSIRSNSHRWNGGLAYTARNISRSPKEPKKILISSDAISIPEIADPSDINLSPKSSEGICSNSSTKDFIFYQQADWGEEEPVCSLCEEPSNYPPSGDISQEDILKILNMKLYSVVCPETVQTPNAVDIGRFPAFTATREFIAFQVFEIQKTDLESISKSIKNTENKPFTYLIVVQSMRYSSRYMYIIFSEESIPGEWWRLFPQLLGFSHKIENRALLPSHVASGVTHNKYRIHIYAYDWFRLLLVINLEGNSEYNVLSLTEQTLYKADRELLILIYSLDSPFFEQYLLFFIDERLTFEPLESSYRLRMQSRADGGILLPYFTEAKKASVDNFTSTINQRNVNRTDINCVMSDTTSLLKTVEDQSNLNNDDHQIQYIKNSLDSEIMTSSVSTVYHDIAIENSDLVTYAGREMIDEYIEHNSYLRNINVSSYNNRHTVPVFSCKTARQTSNFSNTSSKDSTQINKYDYYRRKPISRLKRVHSLMSYNSNLLIYKDNESPSEQLLPSVYTDNYKYKTHKIKSEFNQSYILDQNTDVYLDNIYTTDNFNNSKQRYIRDNIESISSRYSQEFSKNNESKIPQLERDSNIRINNSQSRRTYHRKTTQSLKNKNELIDSYPYCNSYERKLSQNCRITLPCKFITPYTGVSQWCN